MAVWMIPEKNDAKGIREKLDGSPLEKPGRALSRDTILNAVWGNSVFVTPRSIDRCVTTLRGRVEPDPHRPTYIHTLRDIGYRFEPGAPTGK